MLKKSIDEGAVWYTPVYPPVAPTPEHPSQKIVPLTGVGGPNGSKIRTLWSM